MLDFLRHALMLTASVRGQLALLVRLQWIAGQRAAEVMSNAPFAAVVVLKQRICWFDLGEDTKPAQHHHAWVVLDHAHPRTARRTALACDTIDFRIFGTRGHRHGPVAAYRHHVDLEGPRLGETIPSV